MGTGTVVVVLEGRWRIPSLVARWLLLIVAALLLPSAAIASPVAAPPTVRVLHVDSSEHPLVRVVVSLAAQRSDAAFHVEERGIDRAVEARRLSDDELRVGVVVDNAPPATVDDVRAIQGAALELALSLPDRARVVVTGTAGPNPTPAPDAAAAVAAVALLEQRAADNVDRVAAVEATIEALDEGGTLPPMIVLLVPAGAGEGAAGWLGVERVAERAMEVRVLALGRGPLGLPGLGSEPPQLMSSGDAEELRRSARAVALELASAWVLAFRLDDAPPGEVSVRVDPSSEATGGEFRLVIGSAPAAAPDPPRAARPVPVERGGRADPRADEPVGGDGLNGPMIGLVIGLLTPMAVVGTVLLVSATRSLVPVDAPWAHGGHAALAVVAIAAVAALSIGAAIWLMDAIRG